MTMSDAFESIVTVLLLVGSFAAWLQHVYTCIINESWFLLAIGTFAFPIGIMHGVGVWIGIF